MAPPMVRIKPDQELPHRTSVVVIGGGIVGASTALFLAEKGIPVVLCERARSAPSSPAATGAGRG